MNGNMSSTDFWHIIRNSFWIEFFLCYYRQYHFGKRAFGISGSPLDFGDKGRMDTFQHQRRIFFNNLAYLKIFNALNVKKFVKLFRYFRFKRSYFKCLKIGSLEAEKCGDWVHVNCHYFSDCHGMTETGLTVIPLLAYSNSISRGWAAHA